jgi:hypothetical protein
MRRLGIAALAATAPWLLACGGSPHAGSRDSISTHAYAVALEQLQSGERAERQAKAASAQRLIARVAARCQDLLADAPQTEGPIREETFEAVALARRATVKAVLERFIARVAHLRFNDAGAAGEVAHDRLAVSLELAGAPPNVCADARAYRAFRRSVPRGTARLRAQTAAVEALVSAGVVGEALWARADAADRRRLVARPSAAGQEADQGDGLAEAFALQRALGLATPTG